MARLYEKNLLDLLSCQTALSISPRRRVLTRRERRDCLISAFPAFHNESGGPSLN
jgi:hypothetical protein